MKITYTLGKLAAAVAVAAITLVSAGCSSPAHEPKDLEDYRSLVEIDKDWRFGAPKSLTGLLTPAVTSGNIYVAGGDTVYAVTENDGDKIWKAETDSEITSGVGSDGLYVAVTTVQGELEVFDSLGKKLWKTRLTSETSVPPLVGNQFIIVRSGDTRVTAYDARTGEQRWRYQAAAPALTVRSAQQMKFSPAGVLVPQAGGKMLALDAKGQVVFDAAIAHPKGITEVERLCDVVGTPHVDAKMMCAAAFQGNVVCMSSQDGHLIWRQEVDAVTGPVSDGENIYVVTSKGEVKAFDYQHGLLKWTNTDLLYRSPSAPVAIEGGFIVLGDYDGYVHVLSARTGEIVGRTGVSDAVKVAPISTGKGALVQTVSGDVYSLSIKNKQ